MDITNELLDDLQQKAKAAIDSRPPIDIPNTAYAAHMTRFRSVASPDAVSALVEHVRSLTERLQEAEKDAGRYRWLVDNDQLDRGSQLPGVRHAIENYAGGMFDSAIDAAIAQEGQRHE